MSTPTIIVENLRKEFRIGQRERYNALRDVVAAAATLPVRMARDRLGNVPKVEKHPERQLWALDDISFSLNAGEVVGIIGRNGAGKSTLLKVLCRITPPSAGRAVVRGRVGSLLEVGTGFHPELTGRENVMLNGIVLGMRRAEVQAKFDEIVEFAGVSRFIDTPVKRYSSGMQVRLAFAVAAHLEPEVLLVDEVLAVGDAEFQRKCLGKMEDVTREGRTILFVSHNMAAIRTLCPRTIVIEAGRVAYDGPTEQAVELYLESGDVEHIAIASGAALARNLDEHLFQGVRYVEVDEVRLSDSAGTPRSEFQSDESITLTVSYRCHEPVPGLQIVVDLVDENDTSLLRTETLDSSSASSGYLTEPGSYRAVCEFPANGFGERRFYVNLYLIYQGVQHVNLRKVLFFDVEFVGYNGNLSLHSKSSYFRPQLPWSVEAGGPGST